MNGIDVNAALGYDFGTDAVVLSSVRPENVRAARAARQFPQILDKIADGKLQVTGVRVLAPALTHENCAKLLSEAEGKSTEALKEIVAALHPKADVALSIRRLPTPPELPAHPKPPKPTLPSQKNPQSTRFEPFPSRETPAPAIAPAQKTNRPHFERTARERYAFRFAAGKTFRNKYEEARALLSHAIPGGDPLHHAEWDVVVLADRMPVAGSTQLLWLLEVSPYALPAVV